MKESFDFIFPRDVKNWLLDGDPSIRWQVTDNLLNGDKDDIHYHRLHVELEGWGKQLLDLRKDGRWFASFYLPKWKATIWVLLALKRMGIYPLDEFQVPNIELLEFGQHFTGGIMYPNTKEVHPCISGVLLGLLSYYNVIDKRRESIFHYLIETQLDDGGWSCDKESMDQSNFKTTLAVLEGLQTYAERDRKNEALIVSLRSDAHEFLLNQGLFIPKQNPDFEEVNETSYPFPFLRYDILTVLDYFQSIDHGYDTRFEEAINHLFKQADGYRWQIAAQEEGQEPIKFEEEGNYSKWNTMRALRVLKWWSKIRK